LELTDGEREQLERWARRPKEAQALGLTVAHRLGVRAWVESGGGPEARGLRRHGGKRRRFVTSRLDGLVDEPGPGRPRTVDDSRVEEVIVKTL